MVIKIQNDIVVVEDKQKIKTMVGKTKKNILALLSEENLSCEELADMLGKHRSSIYKHIKELLENNLVEVKRDEKIDHGKRKIYAKTADLFIPLPESLEAPRSSDVSIEWDEETTDKVLTIFSSSEGIE